MGIVLFPTKQGKPEGSMSFGTLVVAQAMGDRDALVGNGREVFTLFGGKNQAEVIHQIINAV